MNHTSLVLTVLGPDRPGLVESIAQLVASHGGNWVESRMARLAGQFAGILRVDVPADQADALSAAIRDLASAGMETIVHSAAPIEAAAAPLVHLELVGQDRPGIVREVTHAIASLGVNVDELSTECQSAPNSGQPIFRAVAELRLPAGVSVEQLQTALESVAVDMMVELRQSS